MRIHRLRKGLALSQRQGRQDIPEFINEVHPVPIEILLAYDRDRAVQRDACADEEKQNTNVLEKDVDIELKKLEGARRFVYERLLMEDNVRDETLFDSKS